MMHTENGHAFIFDEKEDGVREASEQSAANRLIGDRIHQRSVGDLLECAIDASDERLGPAVLRMVRARLGHVAPPSA